MGFPWENETKEFGNDISDCVKRVAISVNETQDSFIFSTLADYAQQQFDIIVEKEELARAIGLVRMYRTYGPGIGEVWDTAVRHSAELERMYIKGVRDGVAEVEEMIKERIKND